MDQKVIKKRKRTTSTGSRSCILKRMVSIMDEKKYEDSICWINRDQRTFKVILIHKGNKKLWNEKCIDLYKELDGLSEKKMKAYKEQPNYCCSSKVRFKSNLNKYSKKGGPLILEKEEKTSNSVTVQSYRFANDYPLDETSANTEKLNYVQGEVQINESMNENLQKVCNVNLVSNDVNYGGNTSNDGIGMEYYQSQENGLNEHSPSTSGVTLVAYPNIVDINARPEAIDDMSGLELPEIFDVDLSRVSEPGYTAPTTMNQDSPSTSGITLVAYPNIIDINARPEAIDDMGGLELPEIFDVGLSRVYEPVYTVPTTMNQRKNEFSPDATSFSVSSCVAEQDTLPSINRDLKDSILAAFMNTAQDIGNIEYAYVPMEGRTTDLRQSGPPILIYTKPDPDMEVIENFVIENLDLSTPMLSEYEESIDLNNIGLFTNPTDPRLYLIKNDPWLNDAVRQIDVERKPTFIAEEAWLDRPNGGYLQ